MKHIFTLLLISLLGISKVQAQTVTVHRTNGTSVTFSAADIKSIEFAPAAQLIKKFTGYITVESKFFSPTYYGDSARVEVYAIGDKFLCRFHDGQWGDGEFNVTMDRGQVSGNGTLTIKNPHNGTAKSCEATISGPMAAVAITVPTLMSGTTIKWTHGEPTEAVKLSATYSGENSVMVTSYFGPYKAANSLYKVTANADGTINVALPTEMYKNTPIGHLTLGSFTVSNIAYSEAEKAYVRNYAADGLKVHFKAEADGTVAKDQDYGFTKAKIVVTPGADGTITIVNEYTLGQMPMPITATYQGTKVLR